MNALEQNPARAHFQTNGVTVQHIKRKTGTEKQMLYTIETHAKYSD